MLEKDSSWSNLKSTVEKLRYLEAERKSLLIEIDELKKQAEVKTAVLENEVFSAQSKLLGALESMEISSKKIAKAMKKIKRQKRLSSEEFIKVYDSLWKEGPSVRFPSPDSWERARDFVF